MCQKRLDHVVWLSAGRRALLLPGTVTSCAGVLGGPLHLPRPVVRGANLAGGATGAHSRLTLFFTFLPLSAADLSGMFSDGFFSYGIEPVYNRSSQVRQLHSSILVFEARVRKSDVNAVFRPRRTAHISFAGCLTLGFLLTVQVFKYKLNFHGASDTF